MQKQHIHEVLGRLAEGSPVELVKGVVIGYDATGTLRMYNADMSQEELIVACELTKARATGLVQQSEIAAIVARQIASFAQQQHQQGQPEMVYGVHTAPATSSAS